VQCTCRTHTFTLKLHNYPDELVKEQKPHPRSTPARPVFWKHSHQSAWWRPCAPVGSSRRPHQHQTPATRLSPRNVSRMPGHRERRAEPAEQQVV